MYFSILVSFIKIGSIAVERKNRESALLEATAGMELKIPVPQWPDSCQNGCPLRMVENDRYGFQIAGF